MTQSGRKNMLIEFSNGYGRMHQPPLGKVMRPPIRRVHPHTLHLKAPHNAFRWTPRPINASLPNQQPPQSHLLHHRLP